MAIEKVLMSTLRILVEVYFGLMVDKKNNLMVACEEGTVESVELLCGHEMIAFDSEDSMKRTAPYYAIENKNKNDGEIFLNKLLTHAPHLVTIYHHHLRSTYPPTTKPCSS